MTLNTMPRSEFYAKLDVFIQRLQDERNADVAKRHPSLDESAKKEGRPGYHIMGYDEGGRFVRVWAESGQKFVCYFVEKDTGVIFGSKGWKAYNPNHEYGTLDTLDEYEWSGYYATRKDGGKTLVPKANRR